MPQAGSFCTGHPAEIARVSSVERGLRVKRGKGREQRARRGIELRRGDRLITEQQQRAVIQYCDRSLLYLNQGTEAVLTAPRGATAERGEVLGYAAEDRKFTVGTAEAKASGPKFDVRLHQGREVVIGLRGTTAVKNDRGNVRLKANRETDVPARTAPSAPRAVDGAAATAWTKSLPAPAVPQPTGTSVSAKADIFAAGHPSITALGLDGTPPVEVKLATSHGPIVTFPSVTGQVNCTNGASFNGPDGDNCVGGNTDIDSFHGIAGIIDSHASMFLVGVFLDDAEPQDPAPDRLDFSPNALTENFATLSPQLRQVFFVGDGRANSGTLQQFVVPAGATRLFLGFADASSFYGRPGYYNDNHGSLRVAVHT